MTFSFPVRPLNAPVSAIGYLLQHHIKTEKRTLVIVENEREAFDIQEQIDLFCPHLNTAFFPHGDDALYGTLFMAPTLQHQRIQTLFQILNTPPSIVITTPQGLIQRLPTRSFWSEKSVVLSLKTPFSFQALINTLVDLNYQRAGAVEQMGQFSVRGSIIDFFSPAHSEPIRCDFFGETLETVFFFDPETQRRGTPCTEATLLPPHEFLLSEESAQTFSTKATEVFDHSGQWKAFHEAITQRQPWPGIQWNFSLLHKDPLTSLAHLYDPEQIILTPKIPDLLARFSQEGQNLYDQRKSSPSDALPPLPFDAIFYDSMDFLYSDLKQKPSVYHLSPFYNASSHSEHRGHNGKDKSIPSIKPFLTPTLQGSRFEAMAHHIKQLLTQKSVLLTVSQNVVEERVQHLLHHYRLPVPTAWNSAEAEENQYFSLAQGGIANGFESEHFALITEQDLFGQKLSRKKKPSTSPALALQTFSQGDFLVHFDHGVGRYEGLETVSVGGYQHDCIKLIYQNNDRLFVPVENMDVLSRYGPSEAPIALDKLGGVQWQNRKAKAKKNILEMAGQLIELAALRLENQAEPISVDQGSFDEFCATFPFVETDDQLDAIDDILADLSSGKPMDRLLCGDAGVGKTEVALRAAFVAALAGQQVVVITPTTLLCRQHFALFSKRLSPFGIQVRPMSRLQSRKEIAETKESLVRGDTSVVVSTHALLKTDIDFANLGLVIMDEEHHFGVNQKEFFKKKYPYVHLLSLSATPIPRTLHMSLSGVREMSLIATLPADRLEIQTTILPFDALSIRQALLRELSRHGQVFYVCPRIEDLQTVEDTLRQLIPEARLAQAHGRLNPQALESIMTDFFDKKFDVLLCTSIIESGIDLPDMNTIIVHRSDLFGLAQLYQLRGRVGRGTQQGYAYFLLPKIDLSGHAAKRLTAIQNLESQGAGLQLASQDLDIRGAGNLLGKQQSGHIREVGIELYQSLLQEALDTLKGNADFNGEKVTSSLGKTALINLMVPVAIPETYIADMGLRLSLYRRAAHLRQDAEILSFQAELKDRFGPPPPEVDNFFFILQLKALCLQAGISKIDLGDQGAIIAFADNQFTNPAALIHWIHEQKGLVKLRPDHRLTVLWRSKHMQLQHQQLKDVCLGIAGLVLPH